MLDETPIQAPILVEPAQSVQAMIAAVPGLPHPQPTPEQVRIAEAVFAAQEKEAQTVAGLLGLWTGTVLLNDLAREHFSRPVDQRDDDDEEDETGKTG